MKRARWSPSCKHFTQNILTPLCGRRPLLLLWVANRQQGVGNVPVKRTDEEWRQRLSRDSYKVLINRGTEMAFTSPLYREKRRGTYVCAGCGAPVYKSTDKYDSGTGWPSFSAPVEGSVKLTLQPLYCLGDLGAREVRCASCGGHHGHVFSDGPAPTRKRYCINGVALEFKPEDSEQ